MVSATNFNSDYRSHLPTPDSPLPTPEVLERLKTAAIERWAALGLSSEEVAKLRGTTLVVDDLASNILGDHR
jgi:hypothetical protein